MKRKKEIDDTVGYFSLKTGKFRFTKTDKQVEEIIAAKEKLRAEEKKKTNKGGK
jgi:hypothetical protein